MAQLTSLAGILLQETLLSPSAQQTIEIFSSLNKTKCPIEVTPAQLMLPDVHPQPSSSQCLPKWLPGCHTGVHWALHPTGAHCSSISHHRPPAILEISCRPVTTFKIPIFLPLQIIRDEHQAAFGIRSLALAVDSRMWYVKPRLLAISSYSRATEGSPHPRPHHPIGQTRVLAVLYLLPAQIPGVKIGIRSRPLMEGLLLQL